MGERKSRQQRQRQTRASLLDAAEEVFAERGIHRASLDDVAAAAGLTKGAVYSNFAGKADLLLELMRRRQGEDVVGAKQVFADTPHPPADRLQALGDAYTRVIDSQRSKQYAMLLMEFWLHGMREPAVRGQAASALRSARASTSTEIEAHSQNHDLPLPSNQLAAMTIALDIGIAVQHLIDPEEVSAELFGIAIRLIHGEQTS